MLTNTVGIMVFILIFTVLTAGGVVVMKRLPMERRIKAEPLYFFCHRGRVMPFSASSTRQFIEGMGKLTSLAQASSWVSSFNSHRYEDEYFVFTGEGKLDTTSFAMPLDLTLIISPRPDRGETSGELAREGSRFRQVLGEHGAKEYALQFIVFSDSVETFMAARSLAVQEGYSVNWQPHAANQPLRIGLTGGGGRNDGMTITQ